MRRFDEGSVTDEWLIERGALILHVLASEAYAARAEARKAELEVALTEAKGGNASMLRIWLDTHQHSDESSPDETSCATRFPAQAAAALYANTDVATCYDPADYSNSAAPLSLQNLQSSELDLPAKSWESLRPHARARLKELAEDIQAALPTPKGNADSADTIEQPSSGDLAVLEMPSSPASVGCLDEFTPADAADDELDQFEADENFFPRQESLVLDALPALRLELDADREPRKLTFWGRLSGFTVSMVAHGVLLIALMAMTLKLPDVPRGLGFDASPADSGEAIEVAESLEPLVAMDVISPEVSPEVLSQSALASSVSLPTASGVSSGSVSASAAASASTLAGIAGAATRATGSGGSGRPDFSKAGASFFGAGASGTSFCYVIDGSESMRGGPWEAAKAELLRSLSTLKANHRFYIIFFNQEINAIPEPGQREPANSLLYATQKNLQHAQNWIESLRIARGAPPDAALKCAIDIEPDAIYLLADGATKSDVPKFLRTVNRTDDFVSGEQIRAPIHAIAFYSPDEGKKLMQQIASENKGQFIFVPEPRKK